VWIIIIIQCLYENVGSVRTGPDCIIDIRVTDTDAKSNLSKDPAKVLEAHEKEKEKKYLGACLEQRRTFTPFVVSTDGLIGKEAKTLLTKLSTLLAEKWGKSYSEVCGYVNAVRVLPLSEPHTSVYEVPVSLPVK
jgi:hypothetical protein